MKTNLLKLAFVALFAMISGNLLAEGTQSIKVTFNGTDNANWKVSSNGTITSVENGVMNVQMADQGSSKYRADVQYQTSGTYTFDKTKDVVWAIKLTGALPGSSNSRKFEINYGNNTWINGINGPSGQISCTDGGVIYYFNLGADGLNKLSDVPEGSQTINNIHFILADAVCASAGEARYSVDWVATFASVADLTANKDMFDDGGVEKCRIIPSRDTQIRKGNTTNNSAATSMEVRSTITEGGYTDDFLGLMSFSVPVEAGYILKSAKLRLVTNMCKGATVFNVYSYGNDFAENTTYAAENDYVIAARQTTPIQFTAKYGSRNWSLEDGKASVDNYKPELTNWVNEIDVLPVVDVNNGSLKIMIAASTSNTNAARFFTKEKTGFTNTNANITYLTNDLIPVLELEYEQYIVTRATTPDSYGTICLPYDATSTGVVLMEMAGRNANATGIAFDFVGGTEESATNATLEAGVPYLYRATADAQVFTCDMTSTKATAPATVNCFTGVFVDTQVAAGTYFLYTADDKFHPAAQAGNIGAYKCYLNTTDINNINVAGADTSARACVFGVFGSETTGIEGLNGSSSSTCAKYVQNGQIVVVKNGQKYNTAGQLLK